jgi:hypothetical protein
MDEIEALRRGVSLESSGRFEIDLKAAVRKLGRFLLPSPDDAFLKLVQFGVSQKAEAMTINSTPSGFLVHFLGLSEATPASQMLSQMPEVLAGEVRDRRQPLFQAVNYFLHHGGEVALTVVQGGQIVDTARSANFPSQIAKFPSDGRFAEAVSLEIYARTFIELDAHALKQRLAYCSMPVSWKGKQLNGDREAAGAWTAYGQTVRQEYYSDGHRRTLEINAEVKGLTESERQGSAEVVPVQWGVSLDSIPFQAGAPGIRLIVPADEVETQLGAFKMKPCSAWTDREAVVANVVKSVSNAVHGKARSLRTGHRLNRRLNGAQKSSVKFFLLMLAADMLIIYPKLAESRNHQSNELTHMLNELQPYLPYLITAQIIWLMWQVLIAN